MDKISGSLEQWTIKGSAADNAWIIKNQGTIEGYMLDEMKQGGFLPVLDSRTEISVSFVEDTETFDYEMSIMAYKCGLKKTEQWAGIILSEMLLINHDGSLADILEL
jgi:hypothetical protein